MKLNLLLLLILSWTEKLGKRIDAAFYNCEFLIEAGPPLELMCSAYYTLELQLKYRDKWVKANAPYRIWARTIRKSSRQIFISFYDSAISNCANITCHLNWLHCQDSEMFGIIIHPEEVHCFRKTFAYVRDLQRTCSIGIDESPDYVAIHYAYTQEMNNNRSSATRSICKLCRIYRFLICSIALWLWFYIYHTIYSREFPIIFIRIPIQR